MPSHTRLGMFGKAFSLTVAVFVLLVMVPLSFEVRRVIAAVLFLGWFLLGIGWLIQRFGKAVGFSVLVVVSLTVGGTGWYAYWKDEPNRRLVSQIKGLHAYYVGTRGSFLNREVDYVYFDEQASDDDVRQFTDLDGLNGLKRLVLKGTRIRDVTATRFSRFSQLEDLYIEGPSISQETIDFLLQELPHCKIEVK